MPCHAMQSIAYPPNSLEKTTCMESATSLGWALGDNNGVATGAHSYLSYKRWRSKVARKESPLQNVASVLSARSPERREALAISHCAK